MNSSPLDDDTSTGKGQSKVEKMAERLQAKIARGQDEILKRAERLEKEKSAPRARLMTQLAECRRKAWTGRFLDDCVSICKDRRKTGRRNLAAKGARLVNLIVDSLWAQVGDAAMGVYDALAEKNFRMRKPSELGPSDADLLVRLVANKLGADGSVACPLQPPQPNILCPAPKVREILMAEGYQIAVHEVLTEIGFPRMAHRLCSGELIPSLALGDLFWEPQILDGQIPDEAMNETLHGEASWDDELQMTDLDAILFL